MCHLVRSHPRSPGHSRSSPLHLGQRSLVVPWHWWTSRWLILRRLWLINPGELPLDHWKVCYNPCIPGVRGTPSGKISHDEKNDKMARQLRPREALGLCITGMVIHSRLRGTPWFRCWKAYRWLGSWPCENKHCNQKLRRSARLWHPHP